MQCGEMRLLVLVIATNKPLCQMHTEYWRRVLATCPSNVDVRFVYGEPTICSAVVDGPQASQPRSLLVRTRESFIPGILVKTMQAMKYLLPTEANTMVEQEGDSRYEWILRTNTSTFVHFDNLSKLLPTLDPSAYYGAMNKRAASGGNQTFAVGFFILFSSSSARRLIDRYDLPENQKTKTLPDDVALARLAQQAGMTFRSLHALTVLPHLFHRHLAHPKRGIIAIRNRNYQPPDRRMVEEKKRWEQIIEMYSIA